VSQLRTGNDAGALKKLQAALSDGRLSPKQVNDMLHSGRTSGVVEAFKMLPLPDALEVYGVGTAEERAAWGAPLQAKLDRLQHAKTPMYGRRDMGRIQQALKSIREEQQP